MPTCKRWAGRSYGLRSASEDGVAPAEAGLRRSVLLVSGSDPAPIRRAREAGPDSLVLDLEDTITPSRKPRRVIRAFEEAVDGRMIDLPVVEAERAVLGRARQAGIL